MAEEDGPHSTRAVAAAKAYALTAYLCVVTSRGRWASSDTFLKFYNSGTGSHATHPTSVISVMNMADVMRFGLLAAESASMRPASDNTEKSVISRNITDVTALRSQSSKGIGIRFSEGVWKDAEIPIVGKVTKIKKSKVELCCEYDDSTLHVPWKWLASLVQESRACIVLDLECDAQATKVRKGLNNHIRLI